MRIEGAGLYGHALALARGRCLSLAQVLGTAHCSVLGRELHGEAPGRAQQRALEWARVQAHPGTHMGHISMLWHSADHCRSCTCLTMAMDLTDSLAKKLRLDMTMY